MQTKKRSKLKILLICSAYNGLTQRIHDELLLLKHEVSIEISISADHMIEAVELFEPELILCPYLKERIPKEIWAYHKCIVFHPGIIGDRGAYSLDWAISEEQSHWGVTALQAAQEMDAGDIWSNFNFEMRETHKASLYRNEVTKAAVEALHDLLEKVQKSEFKPQLLDYSCHSVKGELKPPMRQKDRQINWLKDDTTTIIKKINSSDSHPGVLEELYNEEFYLYGAHHEEELKGSHPKEVIAKRNGAICLCTIDGAVWISHLKKATPDSYKLPSTIALKKRLQGVREHRIELLYEGDKKTFKEIHFTIKNEVGYLHFDFHNGAMSIEQCVRLKYAYELALEQDIRVIVLMGGEEFFSNGIHLNIMQESLKQAEDGWSNIHAMNDVVRVIINTYDILTVSSFGSNAGAGGVMMGLASDHVIARNGVILNPHYKTLGLHGSEYWTYLLPKRVGEKKAYELTESCLPIGAVRSKEIGLVDDVFSENQATYKSELEHFCESLAQDDNYYDLLDEKVAKREADEAIKPIEAYRNEELEHMYESFFNENSPFNQKRQEFVLKKPFKQTPDYLAIHRKK